MALQRTRSCGLQLLEGAVKATLQVRVRHNQDAFLVPGHKADLLWNTCVQLCRHMGIHHKQPEKKQENTKTLFKKKKE